MLTDSLTEALVESTIEGKWQEWFTGSKKVKSLKEVMQPVDWSLRKPLLSYDKRWPDYKNVDSQAGRVDSRTWADYMKANKRAAMSNVKYQPLTFSQFCAIKDRIHNEMTAAI